MFGKRGQIGSNEMVYLAIAIIVLVLVVGGFVFNWGGMKDELSGLTGGGKTYASFAQECELACSTSFAAFCNTERTFKENKTTYKATCDEARKDAFRYNATAGATTKKLTDINTAFKPVVCESEVAAVC